jgi:hypothetical protein
VDQYRLYSPKSRRPRLGNAAFSLAVYTAETAMQPEIDPLEIAEANVC